MSTIRINRLHYPVITLGPGVRAGVWVQGCSIGCHGCMSTDTWDAGPEHDIDIGVLLRWLDTLGPVDGVTISGGEPFEQAGAVRELVSGIGERRPDADILVYSGYPLGLLQRRPAAQALLGCCDAVITGPYVARRNPGGRWRGSSNQRLVVLTDRGRERFGADPEAPDPSTPAIQASFDGRTLRLVGVPLASELERLEAELISAGVRMDAVTWHI